MVSLDLGPQWRSLWFPVPSQSGERGGCRHGLLLTVNTAKCNQNKYYDYCAPGPVCSTHTDDLKSFFCRFLIK